MSNLDDLMRQADDNKKHEERIYKIETNIGFATKFISALMVLFIPAIIAFAAHLESKINDVDKRVVRLETFHEVDTKFEKK